MKSRFRLDQLFLEPFPILKTFGERLLASGHAPKAVSGAAMRKRGHLIYGIVRSGEPFRADFGHPALDVQDSI